MAKTHAAEICFYGTGATGAGYLARTKAGKMFGDGTPVAGRCFTEALWVALAELKKAGVEGAVRLFAAGGQFMADVPVTYTGWYGGAGWGPATVLTVSVAAVEAAG